MVAKTERGSESMLNESGSGQLELPNYSLSIADIIGKSSRLLRINYKLAIRLYLFSVGLYYLFAELLYAIVQYTWLPQGALYLRILAGIAGTIMCIAAIYLMRVGNLTLWLLMTRKETNVDAAWKKAKHPRILLYYAPTLIVELFGVFFMTFFVVALKDLGSSSDPASFVPTLTLYFGFLVIWSLPVRAFELFNSLIVYNVLVSKGTFKAGLAKVWSDLVRRPFLIFYALAFMTIVANFVEATSMITAVFDGIIRLFLKLDNSILPFISFFPRLATEVATGVMTSWICAASILLVDNELSIRLDGVDIINSVERLEERS